MEIQGIFNISAHAHGRLTPVFVVLFQEASVTGGSLRDRVGRGSHNRNDGSCAQGEKER